MKINEKTKPLFKKHENEKSDKQKLVTYFESELFKMKIKLRTSAMIDIGLNLLSTFINLAIVVIAIVVLIVVLRKREALSSEETTQIQSNAFVQELGLTVDDAVILSIVTSAFLIGNFFLNLYIKFHSINSKFAKYKETNRKLFYYLVLFKNDSNYSVEEFKTDIDKALDTNPKIEKVSFMVFIKR